MKPPHGRKKSENKKIHHTLRATHRPQPRRDPKQAEDLNANHTHTKKRNPGCLFVSFFFYYFKFFLGGPPLGRGSFEGGEGHFFRQIHLKPEKKSEPALVRHSHRCTAAHAVSQSVRRTTRRRRQGHSGAHTAFTMPLQEMCTSLFALLNSGEGEGKTHTKNHPFCILHLGLFFSLSLIFLFTPAYVNSIPFLLPYSSPERGFPPAPLCPAPSFKAKKRKKKIMKRCSSSVLHEVHPAAVPSRCVARDHLFGLLSDCLCLFRSFDILSTQCGEGKPFFFFLFWTSRSISVPIV